MIGMEHLMAGYENRWDPYTEQSIEQDRDPVLDDPIIYGVNVKHFTLTVYSHNGRVSKYWNARILQDQLGRCRIACPRDGKILCFAWFEWTSYMFSHDGLNELVFMPRTNSRLPSTLWNTKEVK